MLHKLHNELINLSKIKIFSLYHISILLDLYITSTKTLRTYKKIIIGFCRNLGLTKNLMVCAALKCAKAALLYSVSVQHS